jgi:hypothetical protein
MLIPLQIEPAEDYLTRAASAIADAETHIYVDTSLAMWLTAVGAASRAAFIDWTSELVGRIHVPAWTIQEYYRHHRGKTLTKDIDEQCKAVAKAAADFRSQVRLIADGPLLPGEPEAAFLHRIDGVQDELSSLASAARTWNYEEASAEVIGWMNAHALDSSGIFTRFGQLKEAGGARYAHDVPPGYEDRRKGLNRYGDLLFWQDVVADARRRIARRVIVLTRDRKEDWYVSAPAPEVGPALRRLKSRWEPVPSPHPMLSFEMRTQAGCELLLLDDQYLGALLWRADKARFGRFSAVALTISADKLSRELAPPPSVLVRAAARRVGDRISLAQALELVRGALEQAPSAAQLEMLAALEGDAPVAEQTLDGVTPDWVGIQDGVPLASFSRRIFDLAAPAQPFATQAVRRLLDTVDQMDAERASAVVGGMLAAAFYDKAAPRNRPAGHVLQEVYAWAVDPGCERILKVLSNRLRSVQSAAVVLPDGIPASLSVRLEASYAVATVPPTLGQLYLGAQAVLTEQAVGEEVRLRALLGDRHEANVAEIVNAVARHYGVPLATLAVVESADEETWTVGEATGMERFGPLSQPARGNVAPGGPPVQVAEQADALAEGVALNAPGDDDQVADDEQDDDDYEGEEE